VAAPRSRPGGLVWWQRAVRDMVVWCEVISGESPALWRQRWRCLWVS
jgi:hypothetical protein